MTPPPRSRTQVFAESAIKARPVSDAGLTPDPRSSPRREAGGRKRQRPGSQADLFQQLTERDILLALFSQTLSWADAGAAAADIIDEFGTFADAVAASHTKLRCLRSVPPAAIALLQCVQVATVRLAQARIQSGPILSKWEKLEEYLQITMARLQVEECHALLLDPRNRLIRDELIATGGVRFVPVQPRDVVKRALDFHATAIILVHNHPSGDPTPSRDDIELTREIRQAARLMGIVVHDHIIVGAGSIVSLRREGFFDNID